MVNRNLLRQFDISSVESQIEEDFEKELAGWIGDQTQEYETNKIVEGTVLEIRGEQVMIDIGYKSEGMISLREWSDEGMEGVPPPKVGDKIQVLLETVEGEDGGISLSYRKAKRQKEWESILEKHKEGDVVSGSVVKKIKGGLLVNIGVNVFLPASQVDIRRPSDIEEYKGKTIECMILKIDEARRNIVVSRRKLIEVQRDKLKKSLLSQIEKGQVRKGIVKNIAEFGAFVDLGGIDGLLHITDMSWGRVTNPHDVVKIDQELEVYIISVDQEKEKIALGLKQKSMSPWEGVEAKYPINSKHIGEVVNIMTYGAFVKLESGIEGLVHISEMSWTRRINHPSEVVSVGDKVEVQVLNINKDKQEISLGMKQVTPNPWDKVAERYPPNTVVSGVVRNLTNYGAFIEIEEGIDGLLHVSDMSWVKKVTHPSEVVQKGQKVTCVVLNVDQERKRVALGLKQMANDPWEGDIPGRYAPGSVKKGKVTKITNFGVFVELEQGLEGLLHVSELSDDKVENPEDVVKVGDELEVKVLRVDIKDRKIGLSRKDLYGGVPADLPPEPEIPEEADTRGQTDRSTLRGGTGTAGPLIQMPGMNP
ncbi:30S ribosomal protein S1 [Telmatocola sphagniphila]|uniref:Small ribosomal subunit protein bS1 n=1 Tax=Telmatocola sphagniphila TaxID=1123043 RepID=A0A8E6EXI2_9BACT|nr:30S ribosomal protein S1 [Telmatocola sphagniphila]QVL31286.1 30S ribosomal protein S1 [Telmatocola sphagniphila]